MYLENIERLRSIVEELRDEINRIGYENSCINELVKRLNEELGIEYQLSPEQLKNLLSQYSINTKNKSSGYFEVLHINERDKEILLKHKKYRCK